MTDSIVNAILDQDNKIIRVDTEMFPDEQVDIRVVVYAGQSNWQHVLPHTGENIMLGILL